MAQSATALSKIVEALNRETSGGRTSVNMGPAPDAYMKKMEDLARSLGMAPASDLCPKCQGRGKLATWHDSAQTWVYDEPCSLCKGVGRRVDPSLLPEAPEAPERQPGVPAGEKLDL